MKTIIITILSLAIGAALVHAQGEISFFSTAAGVVTNTSYYYARGGGTTGKISASTTAPGAYDFILLAATSTTAADDQNPLGPDWSAVSIYGGALAVASNGPTAGSVTGPGAGTGFSSSLTVGITYDTMLVGWSSNLGDWNDIQADFPQRFENVFYPFYTFFGVSQIGTITPTPEPAPAAPVFGQGTGIPNNSTVLYIVGGPEPTTLSLFGLGGLSLFFFCRRKSISVVDDVRRL